MLLWVAVDIDHDLHKVGVGRDLDTSKRALEEGAGTVVGVVEGLGIGVKEVGKALAGLFGLRGAGRSDRSLIRTSR
jgi:hypothetical protein